MTHWVLYVWPLSYRLQQAHSFTVSDWVECLFPC